MLELLAGDLSVAGGADHVGEQDPRRGAVLDHLDSDQLTLDQRAERSSRSRKAGLRLSEGWAAGGAIVRI